VLCNEILSKTHSIQFDSKVPLKVTVQTGTTSQLLVGNHHKTDSAQLDNMANWNSGGYAGQWPGYPPSHDDDDPSSGHLPLPQTPQWNTVPASSLSHPMESGGCPDFGSQSSEVQDFRVNPTRVQATYNYESTTHNGRAFNYHGLRQPGVLAPNPSHSQYSAGGSQPAILAPDPSQSQYHAGGSQPQASVIASDYSHSQYASGASQPSIMAPVYSHSQYAAGASHPSILAPDPSHSQYHAGPGGSQPTSIIAPDSSYPTLGLQVQLSTGQMVQQTPDRSYGLALSAYRSNDQGKRIAVSSSQIPIPKVMLKKRPTHPLIARLNTKAIKFVSSNIPQLRCGPLKRV
jgi:hypothetical protein